MSLKIIKFTASWCSACKTLSATLDRVLAEFEYADIDLTVVDIEQEPDVAVEYGVTSGLPALIIGDLRMVGNQTHSALRSAIKGALG